MPTRNSWRRTYLLQLISICTWSYKHTFAPLIGDMIAALMIISRCTRGTCCPERERDQGANVAVLGRHRRRLP